MSNLVKAQPTVLIGVYRDGPVLVLVDASETHHRVSSPDQAWAALRAILEDPELPKAKTHPVRLEDDLGKAYEDGCDQVEHELKAEYGPVMGRVFGTLFRDTTKTAGRIARNMRRKGKSR